jgi:hypothetical protein
MFYLDTWQVTGSITLLEQQVALLIFRPSTAGPAGAKHSTTPHRWIAGKACRVLDNTEHVNEVVTLCD